MKKLASHFLRDKRRATSEEAVGRGPQPFRRVDEQREGKSDEQRATSNEAVGNGSQPFRRVDEAVGRGPRTRRKVDEQRGCRERFSTVPEGRRGGCRARFPNAPLFGLFGEQSLQQGTVPTTGDSLHRKHVIAVVGNGSQPFRFSPAGDKSNEVVGNGSQPFRRVDEVVGRGPRTRRFSFRTVRGTVPTTGNSPYNGGQPTSQACNSGCRERFPTVPQG